MDFSFPDQVSADTKYGHVSFPKHHCGAFNRTQGDVYLSTMLTANGFRLILLSPFIEHYARLKVKTENMLFTLQITPDSNDMNVANIIAVLRKYNTYFDI